MPNECPPCPCLSSPLPSSTWMASSTGLNVRQNLCPYLQGSSGAKQGTSSAFGCAGSPLLTKVKILTPNEENKTHKKGNSHCAALRVLDDVVKDLHF